MYKIGEVVDIYYFEGGVLIGWEITAKLKTKGHRYYCLKKCIKAPDGEKRIATIDFISEHFIVKNYLNGK